MKLLILCSLPTIAIALMVLGDFTETPNDPKETNHPTDLSSAGTGAPQVSTRQIPRHPKPRPLWESPLIKEGMIVGVEFTYHTFITWMNLGDDELTYFKTLLNERSLISGTAGLRWQKASSDLKSDISGKLEKDLAENTALIYQFLNNESDFNLFLIYENELPERGALAPYRDDLALEPGQEERLLGLLHQARSATEKKSGYLFESSEFLHQYDDLLLLKTLRSEMDRRIESTLPDILNSGQAEAFLQKWKEIRKEQLKMSETIAKMIQEEGS